ncbi:MAG TPA: hypothetical protein VFE51_17790 [Verrucomicrobiae bacterium]|nr:hypothetical protein [Verrucomicrobiae bacterium]
MSYQRTNQRGRKRAKEAPARSEREPAPELTPEEAQRAQEWLLERIGQGAALCRELETRLRQDPAPELETIIKLYRILVLTLSAEVRAVPELRHVVTALMRPVMEWARLEEKRKDREREEHIERPEQSDRERALRPITVEKIEDDLALF